MLLRYPYGDVRSQNIQVCQTHMARLEGKQIEFPDQYKIRNQLAPFNQREKIKGARSKGKRGYLGCSSFKKIRNGAL